MATKRHQPTTRTIASFNNKVQLSFVEREWLTEGRCAEADFGLCWISASTLEEFEAILLFGKSRGRNCYFFDELDIRIYAKPKSEQRGHDLQVVLGGDQLDDLLDMCYYKIDKSLLKIKLYMTSIKSDNEKDCFKNVTFISKEMVAALNTEDNPDPRALSKYIFSDPDLGTLTEPYLVDGNEHDWKFTLELIADEKDAYGLKLPKLESIEKAVLEEELYTDFILIAGDGSKVPCNKVYLASRSPVFRRMLQSGMKESTENECKLEDMSKEGVKALLKYVYYFCVEDALQVPKIAMELLEAGHKYDITALEDTMKRIFIGKPDEWFTVDAALLLFLWSLKMNNCEDLTSKAVMIINKRWNEARKTSVFQERFARIPKSLEELHSWTLQALDH
ncbi:unnamed protein product [Orchesella dallaii]|uniref:BTB domain-containing protein n=1 Tax=Orchesella dallaii TaxID=48710 RepID=A0ABP1RPW8_9HEXA